MRICLPTAAILLASVGSLSAQVQLSTVRVAVGLTNPTYVTSPPGDEDRLFVTEQFSGLIRIIKRGALLPSPFLQVTGMLTGSERGLLGLAFHPQYAVNGYFYVSFTRSGDGASIIQRFSVSASNPDVANSASGVVCFGPVAQPYSNHNGGNIQFGPDGMIYHGLGDGGSGGDPLCNAQNPASLLGKMLRLDPSTVPFSVPAGNPFLGNTAYRPEIWSLGLRNPWRFSFDRQTGDLYIGDVGQNALEEVNFEPANTGGRNYGWKVMEGVNCYGTSACSGTVPTCNSAPLTRPFYTYATGTNCTVVSGYVYRGCAVPDLRGTYFFADYCSGRIWSCRYVNGSVTEFRDRTAELVPNIGTIGRISSFGEDARGELYICDYNGGEIFQIVARDGGPAVDLGFGKIGSNGDIPYFEVCGRLEPNVSADFILRRAPASTPAVLAISLTYAPTPIFGGTLVPVPPDLMLGLSTDATGRAVLTVPGGLGPSVLYSQWAMYDAGASFSLGISNALKITMP